MSARSVFPGHAPGFVFHSLHDRKHAMKKFEVQISDLILVERSIGAGLHGPAFLDGATLKPTRVVCNSCR